MGPLALPDVVGNDLLRGAWLAANGVTALWFSWLVLLQVNGGRSVSLNLAFSAVVSIAVLILWFKAMLLPAAAVSVALAVWVTVRTTHFYGREQWAIWVYLAIAGCRLVSAWRDEPVPHPIGSRFVGWTPARVWRNLMRLCLGSALLLVMLAIATAAYVASNDEMRAGWGGLWFLVAGVVGTAALGASTVAATVLVVARSNIKVATLVSIPLAAWALGWALPNNGYGWTSTVLSLWGFACLSAALAMLTTRTAVLAEH